MKDLLLLHGAIGSSEQLTQLSAALSSVYKVHLLDFSGHGKNSSNVAFTIEQFADDVSAYLGQNNITSAAVFGYSMGGYVALYLARQNPAIFTSVVTLATKFHWDEPTATRETQMLNPEKIEQKLPAFAETLRARHMQDWKTVLGKTAEMMLQLGRNSALKPEDYAAISTPALIMLGDRDKMVTLEETTAVYKSLPHAQLAILPATAHPIEQVDTEMLSFFIRRFVK